MNPNRASTEGLGRALAGGSSAPGEGFDNARRGASQEDVRGFGDLLGGGEGARGGSEDAVPTPAPMPSPFDLFRPVAGAPGGGPVPCPPPAASELRALAEAIAERLLVSDGDAPGGQEVRIRLKDGVLPGTEVRLRREGGRLVVEFVCANADSLRFLDAQRAGLADVLGHRLKCAADVRVAPSDGTLDDGGRQDGRSRQRYVPTEEMDP